MIIIKKEDNYKQINCVKEKETVYYDSDKLTVEYNENNQDYGIYIIFKF